MLLVDTNIWLELLLEQDRADEVRRFLDGLPSDQIAISHFSLHSIGVILGRYGRRAALVQFVRDLFVVGMVELVTLPLGLSSTSPARWRCMAWTLMTPTSMLPCGSLVLIS